ncbi:MAG: glutaredoxin 3 [Miltoncostaeaceae bacterium]|nr:glutaredoxin 3 [Miltoncostaeaceae bacterium]
MPRVVLFTTERCSFCDRVKMLLARKGVSYDEVYLPRDDMESRRQLVRITGRYTLPQVIVDGNPLGGWEDLRRLEDAGDLDSALAASA